MLSCLPCVDVSQEIVFVRVAQQLALKTKSNYHNFAHLANPFKARCPKFLPFEGFSAILV